MSATPNINPLKIKGNKFDATQGPTSGDDVNDGYNVGSIWIDVSANKAYTCVDATAGNAVWNESGGSGGGGNTIYTANGTIGTGRVATLTDSLTFKSGIVVAEIDTLTSGGNQLLKLRSKYSAGTANSGALLDFENSSNNVLMGRIQSKVFESNNTGLVFYASDVVSGLKERLRLERDGVQIGDGISSGAISTEKISLQGNTLIKGSDNSASTSGFKFIDSSNDSKWDFRNNGDVLVGQNVNIIGDSSTPATFTFCRPANPTGYGAGFNIDMHNSSSAQKTYGRFVSIIESNTAGSETGRMELRVADSGTVTTKLTVNTGGIVVAGNTTSESTSSNAAFIAKGDNSSVDGYIQLNCRDNSHGIKLKSPPHSAGATYTLVFPDNTGSNGQALTTDGSGNLSWGAGTSTDSDAIHDNVPSEISAINLKANVVNADMLLIEDSADNNNKKRTTISNIKTAVASVGTPGIAQSIHSFEIASTTSNTAIGNEVYTVKVIPTVLREVTQMSLFVTFYNVGHVAVLGIYNGSGTLLTQGSVTITGLGINTATLGTSVTLDANTEYYFAIWDDGGVINYASKSLYGLDILGRYQSGLSSSTLPSSIPGSATNKCFWINAF